MAWATKPDARAHWADSAPIPDATLDVLLAVAEEQCRAYAPVLPLPEVVPARYMLATVYQAREVYAAARRGESDVVGVGDFVIRARPLTAAVKQLLRPQSAVKALG